MEKVEDEDEDEGIGDDIGDPCLHNSCVRACENQYRVPCFRSSKTHLSQFVYYINLNFHLSRFYFLRRGKRSTVSTVMFATNEK